MYMYSVICEKLALMYTMQVTKLSTEDKVWYG